jgi:hypothetical protein
MKKAVLGIAMLVAVGALVVRAVDADTAWREKLRVIVTTNGLTVATDTNVTTVTSVKTPAFVGEWLFGGAGTGTNGVWVAKGLTTNDWVQVAP